MKTKIIALILLSSLSFAGESIQDHFKSANYVLSELRINKSFLGDKNFLKFIHKNKSKYRGIVERSLMNNGMIIVSTIKNELQDKGLSPLYIYLAMVESSIKAEATSSTGAAGIWQFTKKTGTYYGLRRNRFYDERRDPLKSTEKASKYLTVLEDRFSGSRYLSIMGYNSGENYLEKKLYKQKSSNLSVLISNRSLVKAETKKYIQKVILYALIGEEYRFSHDPRMKAIKDSLYEDRLVKTKRKYTKRELAVRLNIKPKYLDKMNPHIKDPYKAFVLNIPQSKWRQL